MSEPIQDIEITITLRNNQLKSRRVALGMTQKELAKSAGVSNASVGQLETLRNPSKGRWNQWVDTAIKLSEFFSCPPEQLFPEWLDLIKNPKVTRGAGAEDVMLLAPLYEPAQIPQEALESADEAHALGPAFQRLPARMKRILEMRLDLDGKGIRTLQEVGDELGVSRERTRQIEAKALRQLKHSPEARELAENRGLEWTR